MKKYTKRFVKFYYPGLFFSEESTKEVKSFDIESLKVPSDAFGFSFFETDYVKEVKEEFEGKTRSIKPRYLIGEKIHLDAIPDTSDNHILRSNIENNSATKEAVKTHLGNWQSFDGPGIIVISPKSVRFCKPQIYSKAVDKSL